jgi:hypothetical protein
MEASEVGRLSFDDFLGFYILAGITGANNDL